MSDRDTMVIPPPAPENVYPVSVPDTIAFFRMRMVMKAWWFYLFPEDGTAPTHSIGPISWPQAQSVQFQLREKGLFDS